MAVVFNSFDCNQFSGLIIRLYMEIPRLKIPRYLQTHSIRIPNIIPFTSVILSFCLFIAVD